MTSESSSKAAAAPQDSGVLSKKRWVPWGIGLAISTIVLNFLIFPWLAESGVLLLRLIFPPTRALIPELGSEVSDEFKLALYIASSAMTAIFLAIWLKARHQASLVTAGFRRFSFGKGILYVIGVLVIFLIALPYVMQIVLFLFPGFQSDAAQSVPYERASSGGFTVVQLVGLVIVPPIIEELVFRGVVFPGISRHFGKIAGALISSALFALAHIDYSAPGLQLNVAVYTFVLGLLLCFMYVRLKSIVPGIVLHIVNNFLALLVMTSGR